MSSVEATDQWMDVRKKLESKISCGGKLFSVTVICTHLLFVYILELCALSQMTICSGELI